MRLKRELGRQLDYLVKTIKNQPDRGAAVEKLLENAQISEFQRNVLWKFAGKFDYNKDDFEAFSPEKKRLLRLRHRILAQRPTFRLFGFRRLKRIPLAWRRPRGSQNKQRRRLKGRPRMVKVGYRGPTMTRGLTAKGYEQIRVYNMRQLVSATDKKRVATVSIAATVGLRLRVRLENFAILNGVHVSNPFRVTIA